ncbi:hypothetical protein GOBAR_AA13773 [Gossypium barbadense]|uniref:Uncharacterized protein n=1 Tax=Gossypium barbadense TaxID=3634 RepID=A0A2P5XU42_GOSBA|nr:hypothetical protein GOBAR_AA13773 [Gossypium barbadense]
MILSATTMATKKSVGDLKEADLKGKESVSRSVDDGRDAQAMCLKEFFADPSHFPVDQISRHNSLGGFRVALGKGRKAIRRKLGNVTVGEC